METGKIAAACRFCGHSPVRVVEATERQAYKHGYDYVPGQYYIGTCPACQMRDCHPVDEVGELEQTP